MSKRDSKIQMVGSEADLQFASPLDERHRTPGISTGTLQMIGSDAMLNRNGTDMTAFDKHPDGGGGKLDMIGSQAEMASTSSAYRHWTSWDTPFSNDSLPDRDIELKPMADHSGRPNIVKE